MVNYNEIYFTAICDSTQNIHIFVSTIGLYFTKGIAFFTGIGSNLSVLHGYNL